MYVSVEPFDEGLKFLVTFHDNYQKLFKFNRLERSGRRCSDRDFIENCIREYYEDQNIPLEGLSIYFL